MISREEVREILEEYDPAVKVGAIASHSALDVFDGATEEGLATVAVCQKGRDATYSRYFRAMKGKGHRGIVDRVVTLDKFADVLQPSVQKLLRSDSVILVPNRSLTSYAGVDAVEEKLFLPLFGSRNLLRTEEREEKKSYYWLLEKARIPFPERIEDPQDIDALVIVKLHHRVKKLERGFFTAASYEEYREKVRELLKHRVISAADLEKARIERYVVGPVFNLDFFYSPLEEEAEKLELLGVDWRFESSLDGHVRLPALQQMTLNEAQRWPEYTVVGHNAATLRESLLERAFELGEAYVKATQRHYKPGIIGPFTLQTCVDKDMEFWCYDVAPRTGGGTNVHMSVGHPYGNALWRRPMSTGRRIALEIKRAAQEKRLAAVVT
ncbi:MAG TPA: formate--phosphoribosylaminoimidazolecarboxamide ligase family protein [Thermoplasmata archaeon]|nr:formate--phosphoribosylaminoimidazolecarboxamide ligase family protein [Thermoplasmata archaeon]